MKIFHAGDKVRFISTKGSGIVTSVKNNIVNVLIEDGFEIPVEASDLVLIESEPGKKNPFVRKNEFSRFENTGKKIEKDENPRLEKALDINSAPDNNKNKKPDGPAPAKGLYLAFVPENQETLGSGNLDVFLINYSKWLVAFHFLNTDPKSGFVSTANGLLEKGDATIIDTITEHDLKNWNRIRIQTLCIDPFEGQLFDSEIIDLEIKTSKFIKEDIYTHNPFLDEQAHVIFVHDLSHPPLAGQKADLFVQTPIQAKTSVIDRYMIDNETAEVDLHIEKMRGDHKSMRKEDIMPVQLAFFRQCLDAAIAKGIRKVVFIHGVGVGLLKKELSDILKMYADIEYEDASILKYGIGATEVRLTRNSGK